MTGGALQFMIFGMAGPGRRILTPASFKRAFMERTKAARIQAGFSYAQIAERLSEEAGRPVVADSYRKWEKTALLPHDLIPAFCELTRVHPLYLLEGPPIADSAPPR